MTDPRLVPGLLACVRTQLLRFCAENPDHPHHAELAETAEISGCATATSERSFGPGALRSSDGLTYHPWSDGAAIGYRCIRDDGGDHFIYLTPPDTKQPTGATLLYCGEQGDPTQDPVIGQTRVPNAAADPARVDQPETVTVELPWDGRLRLGPDDAARVVVAAYGDRARHISISARRSAFTAYWDAIDHLLAQNPLTPAPRAIRTQADTSCGPDQDHPKSKQPDSRPDQASEERPIVVTAVGVGGRITRGSASVSDILDGADDEVLRTLWGLLVDALVEGSAKEGRDEMLPHRSFATAPAERRFLAQQLIDYRAAAEHAGDAETEDLEEPEDGLTAFLRQKVEVGYCMQAAGDGGSWDTFLVDAPAGPDDATTEAAALKIARDALERSGKPTVAHVFVYSLTPEG